MNMTRTIQSAIAGAALLGLAPAAYTVTGEYDNLCAEGLALGMNVKTDCSATR
jgi:hypothetical protein